MTDLEQAIQDCRAAFEAHPEATLAWCCHHEVEIEPLTESWQNRLDYILRYKPQEEQFTRLINFRPVVSPLPEYVQKACADYNKTSADWVKACADYNKTSADYSKAYADWVKARADYSKAYADYSKARADWVKASAAFVLSKEHLADVPNHTWNGRSIFA